VVFAKSSSRKNGNVGYKIHYDNLGLAHFALNNDYLLRDLFYEHCVSIKTSLTLSKRNIALRLELN
jgi:hypothetical protein